MKIEAIGMPGVGKTTLLHRLADQLTEIPSDDSIAVIKKCAASRPALLNVYLRNIIRLLTHNPLKAFQLLQDRKGRWLVKKISSRMAGMRKNSHTKHNLTLYLDCGVIQPIISSVAEIELESEKIPVNALLADYKLPDILLVFSGKLPEAREQYLHRVKEKAQVPKGTSETFSNSQVLANQVSDYCRKRNAIVLKYDNTNFQAANNIASIVDDIRQAILELEKREGY